MSLVTIQRSPSPSNNTESNGSDDGTESVDGPTDGDSCKSPQRLGWEMAHKRFRKVYATVSFISRLRLSESYLAVKGAALILPQSSCTTRVRGDSHPAGIQSDLQSMFYLLRAQDTLKVAVKLESTSPDHSRYMAVVSTIGKMDSEESVLIGVDIATGKSTIGMVLPIWGDTTIQLDGDGGFSIDSHKQHRVFKPVSVQAMWSAIQSVSKVRDVAAQNNYHQKGLTHTWIQFYEAHVRSSIQHVKEWTAMEDIESHKPHELVTMLGEADDRAANEALIKSKLKEIMMTVDLEEVTSKYLRTKLEEEMDRSLKDYKQFIDEQMIIILRQMDAPSQIFDYLYLGSEWNASNLEELRNIEIGHILNVTREIDNFYADMFAYKNIREYDVPQTNLLKYWEDTHDFIASAKRQNSKVLVHCKMGVSRSASTVIAYAMKAYGWDLDQAYQFVKNKRSCIKPNEGFLTQLHTYQGILNASKQRHNTLWRSQSVGNLSKSMVSTPRQEETLSNVLMDLAGDADTSRPRSWSPQDTTTKLLLKTQDFAGDSSGDDIGEDCALTPEPQCSSGKGCKTGRPLWDSGWDHLSNSADSLDVLSDVPSPPEDKPSEFDFGPESDGCGIVLLSHRMFSDGQQDSDDAGAAGQAGHSDSELSDLENIMLEEAIYRSESGYYDVGMLRSDTWLDYMEEGRDMDVLHPDIKMELLMAEQKKHRRIAKLLELGCSDTAASNSTLQGEVPVVIYPADTESENLVPPNTPSFTKIRSDTSWIKPVADSPMTPPQIPVVPILPDVDIPDSGEDTEPLPPVMVSSADFQSSSTSLAVTVDEPTSKTEDESMKEEQPEAVIQVEGPSVPQVCTESNADGNKNADSDTQQSDLTSETKSEQSESVTMATSSEASSGEKKEVGVWQHYEKESIPWNPGLVKKQKMDLEDKFRDGSNIETDQRKRCVSWTSDTASDTSISGVTEQLVDSATVPEEMFVVGSLESTSGSEERDVMFARPLSIYESEDIQLSPGIVQRTRQEIEARERSASFNDLNLPEDGVLMLDGSENSKPVQRSSSLRADRPRRDRDSDRRKTCMPILRLSPMKVIQPSPERDLDEDAMSMTSDTGSTLSLVRIGNDEFELVAGSVKRHARGWEETVTKVDLLDPGLMTRERSKSPFVETEVSIESGAVKRQTQEIEYRYQATSPGSTDSNTPALEEISPDKLTDLPTTLENMEQPVGSPMTSGLVSSKKQAIEDRMQAVEIRQMRKKMGSTADIAEAKYRMSFEMLDLISEVGRQFLESVTEGDVESPHNGLVKRLTTDIEQQRMPTRVTVIRKRSVRSESKPKEYNSDDDVQQEQLEKTSPEPTTSKISDKSAIVSSSETCENVYEYEKTTDIKTDESATQKYPQNLKSATTKAPSAAQSVSVTQQIGSSVSVEVCSKVQEQSDALRGEATKLSDTGDCETVESAAKAAPVTELTEDIDSSALVKGRIPDISKTSSTTMRVLPSTETNIKQRLSSSFVETTAKVRNITVRSPSSSAEKPSKPGDTFETAVQIKNIQLQVGKHSPGEKQPASKRKKSPIPKDGKSQPKGKNVQDTVAGKKESAKPSGKDSGKTVEKTKKKKVPTATLR